jgi:phage-related tail protein
MGIAKTLKASVVIAGGVSPAFRAALATTKNGLKAIGEEIVKVEKKQRLMAQSINVFGRQGRSVDGLRRQYAELTREADRLRAAQARLARVEEMRDANAKRRRELGSKLREQTATFGMVAAATFAPIRSAVQFETAMLGVAKQLNGARDAAGNLTPAYHRMSKQVQRLGREIPIATTELADMVAAGLRMGVAEDQVISFTRTAAMMADAFELPAGQLADDMGKIAGLFRSRASASWRMRSITWMTSRRRLLPASLT